MKVIFTLPLRLRCRGPIMTTYTVPSVMLPPLRIYYTVFFMMSIKKRQESQLTQVIPDIHFSAQRSDFNDALSQEIVRFPLQTLLHSGLDVIIFIPHSHFDSV